MDNYTPLFTDKLRVQPALDHWDKIFPQYIATDRLEFNPLIEDVRPEEIQPIYEANKGTDQYFNTTFGIPKTHQDVLNSYKSIQKMQTNNDDMFYSLRNPSRELIGQATIEDVDLHAQRCGIGVWIKQTQWGEGIAQERAEALLYAIFTEMPIETVEIRVATNNQKSINSVLKYIKPLGGTFEGRLRNISVNPDRDKLTMFVWSITQDEFFDPDATYTEEITPPRPNN